jgi:ketopantoate reductase
LPILYLRGVSTGDFQEALAALLGKDAPKLRLETQTFDEHVRVSASTEGSAVQGAQLVLFCVKSTDTESGAAAIKPHLAPDAVVLSLQNGGGFKIPWRDDRRSASRVVSAIKTTITKYAPRLQGHRLQLSNLFNWS